MNGGPAAGSPGAQAPGACRGSAGTTHKRPKARRVTSKPDGGLAKPAGPSTPITFLLPTLNFLHPLIGRPDGKTEKPPTPTQHTLLAPAAPTFYPDGEEAAPPTSQRPFPVRLLPASLRVRREKTLPVLGVSRTLEPPFTPAAPCPHTPASRMVRKVKSLSAFGV
jgi:hypothetical protein